jgi:hypothetical protein
MRLQDAGQEAAYKTLYEVQETRWETIWSAKASTLMDSVHFNGEDDASGKGCRRISWWGGSVLERPSL